ncbi:hypothetical protein [Roseiconus lacunae]|uniref:hypothetical protein n=1 Tax=Roseiconus lacunae TaxID=2605694 RepID=UPI0011F20631|nr:hypothetical protein [Roseiconus lacunae]
MINSRLACCVALLVVLSTATVSAQWDPNDSTFDPALKSVVIGNRTWIGDPSPFVHQGTKRTGYTHVNANQYEGMDPSVGVSLMVPLEIGETKPVAGGIVMMNVEQAKAFVKAAEKLTKKKQDAESKVSLKTMIKDMNWTLSLEKESPKSQVVVLGNKSDDSDDRYQFSINAMKKLIGAVQHAINTLVTAKASPSQ